MLRQLLPASVAVVETDGELGDDQHYPQEAALVARAVERRKREFVTGRACARQALRQLGVGPIPIGKGESGEPLWPAGIIGSITHCDGYRACAVARAAEISSVGIDCEVNRPLPDGVLESIAFGAERGELTRGPRRSVHADRLLFVAKEAVYKAWFPLAGRWLGFEDVALTIDHETHSFRARLLVPGPILEGRALSELNGRWTCTDRLIAAAVIVLRAI